MLVPQLKTAVDNGAGPVGPTYTMGDGQLEIAFFMSDLIDGDEDLARDQAAERAVEHFKSLTMANALKIYQRAKKAGFVGPVVFQHGSKLLNANQERAMVCAAKAFAANKLQLEAQHIDSIVRHVFKKEPHKEWASRWIAEYTKQSSSVVVVACCRHVLLSLPCVL